VLFFVLPWAQNYSECLTSTSWLLEGNVADIAVREHVSTSSASFTLALGKRVGVPTLTTWVVVHVSWV
jgi:hypothetical protein